MGWRGIRGYQEVRDESLNGGEWDCGGQDSRSKVKNVKDRFGGGEAEARTH